MSIFEPAEPLGSEFTEAIGDVLTDFLSKQQEGLTAISDDLAPLARAAIDFTTGGKRVRPACCAWGWVAAAGVPADPSPLLRAAASLDLLHVSALMHDDVMDASDTRRGLPSAHRRFAAEHRAAGLRGDPEAFGRAGAILLGDALLVWSEELFRRSGFPEATLSRGREHLEGVRTEVTAGQFLDIGAQAIDPLLARDQPDAVMSRIRRVVEFKTARYTIVRPLQIGAALAGAGPELITDLGSYGSAIGRAFQYRDDVLGIFGDPELTGKPAGDDLREGKLTVLVAHAIALAEDRDAVQLAGLLGDPDLTPHQIDRARQIILDSGALAAAESEIASAVEEGFTALEKAPVHPLARTALSTLADLLARRDT